MALVSPHTRAPSLRTALFRAGQPVSAFATTALLGAVMAVALALALTGGRALPSAAALLAYAIATAIAGRALWRDYPHARLGGCNIVTQGRLVLVAGLVGPLLSAPGPSWAAFAVAAVALSLDGVDGWLARRHALASRFGARFDMEVDAALSLVLALNAALGAAVGPVVLLLAAPRYVFAASARVLPWMQRQVPERFSRKVVCVLQLGVLVALQAPALPAAVSTALVVMAVAALAWSFAVDLVWLRWRA